MPLKDLSASCWKAIRKNLLWNVMRNNVSHDSWCWHNILLTANANGEVVSLRGSHDSFKGSWHITCTENSVHLWLRDVEVSKRGCAVGQLLTAFVVSNSRCWVTRHLRTSVAQLRMCLRLLYFVNICTMKRVLIVLLYKLILFGLGVGTWVVISQKVPPSVPAALAAPV